MIPRTPTPEDVIALAAHLGAAFKFTVERKDKSEICRLVARTLEGLHIQSADAFLGSYVTTLPNLAGPGSVVYCPFDLGVPDDTWGLRAQHDVAIHEAVHAHQYQVEGLIYCASYLASQYDRAIYEAVAYSTRYELADMRQEAPPEPAALASHLASYGCGAEAIEACRVACESLARTYGAGGRSVVGRVVEEWWASR